MSLRTLASVSLFTVKFSGDVLKRHWLSSRLTKHIHMYMTLSWNQVPESCPHSPQRVTIHLLSISKILTKYCRQSLSIWLTMQVNMYLHICKYIIYMISLAPWQNVRQVSPTTPRCNDTWAHVHVHLYEDPMTP